MKYLIVGLGNMHPDYTDTRHNVGFDIVHALADEKEATFSHEQLGDLCEVKYKGRTLVLLKPSTYMNRSGKAVRYWTQKKKIQSNNLLVIVDDIHLPFGQMRLRGKGGDGGHNGLKDIQQLLGTSQYARLRVGIGRDFPKGRQSDFVLGQWSADESDGLPTIRQQAIQVIYDFVSIGLSRTMDRVNKRLPS